MAPQFRVRIAWLIAFIILSDGLQCLASCADPQVEAVHNSDGMFVLMDPCIAYAQPLDRTDFRAALAQITTTPTVALYKQDVNATFSSVTALYESPQPINETIPVCTRAHVSGCLVRGVAYELMLSNLTVVAAYTVPDVAFPLNLSVVETAATHATFHLPVKQLPSQFTKAQIRVCSAQHGSVESAPDCEGDVASVMNSGVGCIDVEHNVTTSTTVTIAGLRPWTTFCASVLYVSANYDVHHCMTFTTKQAAFTFPPKEVIRLQRDTHLILRLKAHPQDVPWPSLVQTFRVSVVSEYGDQILDNERFNVYEKLGSDTTGVEQFAIEPTSAEIVFTVRTASLMPYTCYSITVAFDSGEYGTSPPARITCLRTLPGAPLQPDPPVIDMLDSNGMLHVSWTLPSRTQAPIDAFELVANVDEEAEVLGAIVSRSKPADTAVLVAVSRVDVLHSNATFNLRLRIVNSQGVSPLSALALDPNQTHAILAAPTSAPSSASYTPGAVLGPAAVVLVCALLGIALLTFTQRRRERENVLELPVPDEWERPRQDVMIGGTIGYDGFGEEFDGTLKQKDGPSVGITVRKCSLHKRLREKREFLLEAELLKSLARDRHPNIINLVGCCLQDEPLLILAEQASLGDLRKYLHQFSPLLTENTLPLTDRLRMMHNIADGMAYLHSHGIMHRDLAARNCYVTTTGTVKLAAFARRKHTPIGDGDSSDLATLPVRWLGPEAFVLPSHTFGMDVWAFGVTAWEIETYGRLPYTTLTNEQVCSYVVRGQRLDRPAECPFIIYEMMLCCWSSMRPSFQSISSFLETVCAITPTAEEQRFIPLDFVDDYTASLVLDALQSQTVEEPHASPPSSETTMLELPRQRGISVDTASRSLLSTTGVSPQRLDTPQSGHRVPYSDLDRPRSREQHMPGPALGAGPRANASYPLMQRQQEQHQQHQQHQQQQQHQQHQRPLNPTSSLSSQASTDSLLHKQRRRSRAKTLVSQDGVTIEVPQQPKQRRRSRSLLPSSPAVIQQRMMLQRHLLQGQSQGQGQPVGAAVVPSPPTTPVHSRGALATAAPAAPSQLQHTSATAPIAPATAASTPLDEHEHLCADGNAGQRAEGLPVGPGMVEVELDAVLTRGSRSGNTAATTPSPSPSPRHDGTGYEQRGSANSAGGGGDAGDARGVRNRNGAVGDGCDVGGDGGGGGDGGDVGSLADSDGEPLLRPPQRQPSPATNLTGNNATCSNATGTNATGNNATCNGSQQSQAQQQPQQQQPQQQKSQPHKSLDFTPASSVL
ncbi:TK protein kinase [Salpingoeca rosetta]|uniref:receptor protein-tyrosine kinase n=1 Tax=Salpingoeca rosetta (strain ATCC 50818 / BSB-021) TaxID=946362 RepID=F2UKA5_SALR5|nr:TK protein kinase [Salpingoeca rosetta]EGD77554.1 TK protein kinase [Salpingoeca rosetta]|eukprot:XP_004990442.1 TK protein kinase [Salpingoeca rosetta]